MGVLAVVAASVVAARMLCRHSEVKKVDIETATLVCSTPATGQVVDVPQKDAINAVVVSVKEPTAPLSQLDSNGAIPPKVRPAVEWCCMATERQILRYGNVGWLKTGSTTYKTKLVDTAACCAVGCLSY